MVDAPERAEHGVVLRPDDPNDEEAEGVAQVGRPLLE